MVRCTPERAFLTSVTWALSIALVWMVSNRESASESGQLLLSPTLETYSSGWSLEGPSVGEARCAPQVPPLQRDVVFVLSDQVNLTGASGEYYFMRAFAEATRMNGFTVKSHPRVDKALLQMIGSGSVHRVYVSSPEALNCSLLTRPSDHCKFYMQLPQNWPKLSDLSEDQWATKFCGLPPRQIVVPFPDTRNNFIGYWPLHAEPPKDAHARGKMGLLLLAKRPYYRHIKQVISLLLDLNFSLYGTWEVKLDTRVQEMGRLSLDELAQKMQELAFVLGAGNLNSPSPLEALANGVAFLNGNSGHMQHDFLDTLGPPYVYRVDLGRPHDVVDAARSAVEHRFASYVPWQMTREATVARVCRKVLNDVQPCLCAGAALAERKTKHSVCTRTPTKDFAIAAPFAMSPISMIR